MYQTNERNATVVTGFQMPNISVQFRYKYSVYFELRDCLSCNTILNWSNKFTN